MRALTGHQSKRGTRHTHSRTCVVLRVPSFIAVGFGVKAVGAEVAIARMAFHRARANPVAPASSERGVGEGNERGEGVRAAGRQK